MHEINYYNEENLLPTNVKFECHTRKSGVAQHFGERCSVKGIVLYEDFTTARFYTPTAYTKLNQNKITVKFIISSNKLFHAVFEIR